eukprot:symbB.v1.2.007452.t1/scaffold445.1/size204899/15
MSQSPLAAELHQLRVELAHLSSRVLALEEAALRERVGPTPYGSPVTVNYLGTNQLPEIPPFPLASPSTLPPSRTSSQQLADSPGASSAPVVTEADRRRIAEEAGAFLRRSLDGDHRGGSGRSRVPLPSTVYILARDINGMSEEEGLEVPETPNPVVLRRCTVLNGSTEEIDSNYPVGLFEVADSAGDVKLISVILVGEVENRLIAVFPLAAWHRTLARRQIPAGALVKPVKATVGFLDRETDPEGAPQPRKVWVGTLGADFETCVIFDAEEESLEPDLPFDTAGPDFLPTAHSLVELFDQQYSVSATSGLDPPGQAAVLPSSALDKRLQKLEESLGALTASFQQLTGGSAFAGLSRPPALRRPAEPCIPEEQIKEMARLASQGQTRLSDFPLPKANPKPKVARPKNVLSESEDEEEETEAEAEPLAEGVKPLVQAVTKLTEIAGHLSKQKKKDSSLESLLDGCGSVGSSESSTGSGRKYAAALRALRRTLARRPSEIYQATEKNMEEDFSVRTQLPGSNPVQVSARAWLELRSRIQGFVTPVKLLWSVAGSLDSLRAGNSEECRARLNLILAAGDQMSIDRGSWVVASEILLEEPPPMSVFQSHLLPTDSEAPYTRLIDARWFEIFLQKLQDYDNLTEKKKKLSSKRFPRPEGSPAGDTVDPKPKPKIKPKGKGKGRGDGSGFECDWIDAPPVAASDMGRTAGKVETLEDMMAVLHREAATLLPSEGSGLWKPLALQKQGGRSTEERKRPAGRTTSTKKSPMFQEVQVAKEIEANRLTFGGRPAFEPLDYLDEPTAELYRSPFDNSMAPEECLETPPRVQVRGTRPEILKLLQSLDSTGRLELFKPEEVRMSFRSGLFSLIKNQEVDRMIMDSRPHNLLEKPLTSWTRTMAAVPPLLDLVINPEEKVLTACEDLRDYYYYFRVSRQRSARNALKFELTHAEASKFRAYREVVDPTSSPFLVPSLRTMAMGDLNSVEYGQQSHLQIALSCGILPTDLLTMKGSFPRQAWA